jgi:hypothetical protein
MEFVLFSNKSTYRISFMPKETQTSYVVRMFSCDKAAFDNMRTTWVSTV